MASNKGQGQGQRGQVNAVRYLQQQGVPVSNAGVVPRSSRRRASSVLAGTIYGLRGGVVTRT